MPGSVRVVEQPLPAGDDLGLCLDPADPGCALDVVPNKARPATLQFALSNTFAFGGLNASLVFQR